jgi:surfeit locus 1 family protein
VQICIWKSRRHTVIFSSSVWALLLVLVLCGIMLALSRWQLYRYHYKQDLLRSYHSALVHPVLSLDQLLVTSPRQYMPVAVHGSFVPGKNIWLENQYRMGHAGFDLLQPFKVAKHQPWLLINRGWLPAPQGAFKLPQVPANVAQHQVTGRVKTWQQYVYTMGPKVLNPGAIPLRIQAVDFSAITKSLGHAVYPFVLQQAVSKNSPFVRQWLPLIIMPERHFSYMLQWIGFALSLLVVYICFCSHRVD